MKEKIIKVLKRFKNKKVLIAAVSGVALILVNTGIITADVSTEIMNTFNTILGIFVALGIVSDSRSNDEKSTNDFY